MAEVEDEASDVGWEGWMRGKARFIVRRSDMLVVCIMSE